MNQSPAEELRTPTPAEVRQVDRICDRFEEAWRAGSKPRIEDYLIDVEDRVRSYLRHELIQLEQEIVHGDGETASAAGGESVRQECSVLSAGRFEILEEIGRGGMGVVYKARQVGLDRLVALKMILAGAYAGEEEQSRFRREATSAARLHHPHIVQIYEVGELDGQPYFALEFVEGGTLAHKIAGASQPPRDSARLVETLARAVHYAHTQGIVHRDLKPANILLKTAAAENGDTSVTSAADSTPFHLGLATVKIADFGVAKLLDDGTAEIPHIGRTRTGAILGTPSYMAPEQAEGKTKEVGPAADVYALGAILYELVTGRPPFQSASPLETLLLVKEQEPVAPVDLQPKLSRDLNTICLKCLQKEPARRYASAHELAEDLRCFLHGEPIRARPVGTAERLWRWCRRRPLVAALTGTIALLVAFITIASPIAAFQLRRERDLGRERLWESRLNEARANRLSGQIGQRFNGLNALAKAASVRASLELRNEAIACMALVDLRVLHEWEADADGARTVAFEPTLQRYAYLDSRGIVHVCQAADGEELFQLGDPIDKATSGKLIYSPDGQSLAVTFKFQSEHHCWVWNLDKRSVVLKVPARAGIDLGFSADGSRIAVSQRDEFTTVYDARTGKEINRWPAGKRASCVALHPNGRQIAVTSDDGRKVKLCDVDTGKPIDSLEYLAVVRAMAWRGDGRILAAACYDHLIYVTQIKSKTRIAVLKGHTRPVTDLSFSPGGHLLVSSSQDDASRLWDPLTGQPLATAPANALCFSNDQRRLAFRNRARLGVWEIETARECRRFHHVPIPDVNTGTPYAGPLGVDISPDGRLLASSSGDGVRLRDVDAFKEIAHLSSLQLTDTVTFRRDGRALFTYGLTGLETRGMTLEHTSMVDVIQLDAPRLLHPPRSRHHYRIFALSTKGDLVAAIDDASNAEAIVLRVHEPNEKVTLRGLKPGSIALSPDGLLVAGGAREKDGARIWNARTGEPLIDLPGSGNGATVAFSPDGRYVVVGGQKEYRFWEVGTWQAGLEIPRDRLESDPGPAAFTSDGTILAIARSARIVQLVDPASGAEIATLTPSDPHVITRMCFSPDGSRLAVATSDNVVHLWDLRLIRNRLAEMGLDWNLPPYPAEPAALAPLRIEVLDRRERD